MKRHAYVHDKKLRSMHGSKLVTYETDKTIKMCKEDPTATP